MKDRWRGINYATTPPTTLTRLPAFSSREHNGKVTFRSAQTLLLPPSLSPVGDFRNGLETPLNFSLNRVIIQRGSGAAAPASA